MEEPQIKKYIKQWFKDRNDRSQENIPLGEVSRMHEEVLLKAFKWHTGEEFNSDKHKNMRIDLYYDESTKNEYIQIEGVRVGKIALQFDEGGLFGFRFTFHPSVK